MGCSIAAGRWITAGLRWLRLASCLLLFQQSRINLFGAQIPKRWINQQIRWQRDSVVQQDGVNRVIGRFIPQLQLTVAAPAVMGECNMHDLMRDHAFQFCRRKLGDERRIVNEAASIRGHRREA